LYDTDAAGRDPSGDHSEDEMTAEPHYWQIDYPAPKPGGYTVADLPGIALDLPRGDLVTSGLEPGVTR
jgi:hypothetical protein